MARPSIEPITEHIPDQGPIGKAQRIDRLAYESPALPLSYSASAIKLIERYPERQLPVQERMTIDQHMSVWGPIKARTVTTA